MSWGCLSCLVSSELSELFCYFFFFNDTATTEIYTLSLHDALPISWKVNEELGSNLEGNPHILNVLKQVGPGSSKATVIVNLSPGETRDLSSPEITDLIRQQVGELSGVEKLSFNSGANIGGSPVSVSLQGKDIEKLNEAKQLVYEELRSNPKVKDIVDSSPKGIKEINLTLKDNAQLLGLSLNDVMRQVRNAFFGNEAQRLQRGENEVKVWVRYAKQNRSSLNDINDIEIVTQNGRVPLSEIATYSIERGDVAINHLDGIREITVDADMVNPKESATSVMQKLRTEVSPQIEAKYPGITVSFEGQNREVGKIARSAGNVLLAVVFLIYVVIVFAFRSYSQPFLLLALIPLGIIGVALGHWIHGFPVNVLSMLGVVALLGIEIGRHTSELQSPVPISYAVFCLKKKKKNTVRYIVVNSTLKLEITPTTDLHVDTILFDSRH